MELTYRLLLSEQAMEDIAYFKKLGDDSIKRKISKLTLELETHPLTGTGQPEQLKHQLSGCMSRRINKEHRLLYMVDEDQRIVRVLSLRGHY